MMLLAHTATHITPLRFRTAARIRTVVGERAAAELMATLPAMGHAFSHREFHPFL
eukprot:CAMPEP_0182552230 /NCGR_PEP_ID=MMETSP1323-20130603/47704_1 /TAXON_ID=236787 /ORGANISM="Florenciella parvula, Strain RCC1693" /LENGTH=54 /DNA_ID=CAMNT_0024763907 /DNA_START=48 /DNA_END=209 /DNA_ORIENTATION=-